jgi:hypothetical protein
MTAKKSSTSTPKPLAFEPYEVQYPDPWGDPVRGTVLAAREGEVLLSTDSDGSKEWVPESFVSKVKLP